SRMRVGPRRSLLGAVEPVEPLRRECGLNARDWKRRRLREWIGVMHSATSGCPPVSPYFRNRPILRQDNAAEICLSDIFSPEIKAEAITSEHGVWFKVDFANPPF